ncbi:MAG: signal peptidase I [Robiginitomaculum sp.]
MLGKSTQNNDDKNSKKVPKISKQAVMEELKFIIGLLAFLLVFFNLIFGHFKIPSESMQPTLEVGDHLYVSKYAYGWSKHSLIGPLRKIPFLKDGRIFGKMPKHGDVIVFRNPHSGIVMIKRLIGLQGDKIQTIHGRLYVNDQLIDRTELERFDYREHKGSVTEVTRYEEKFADEKRVHQIYERSDYDNLDNRGPFIIPQNKLFFMGDNRDNSTDSRAPRGPGFVPFDHVIGKAQIMVYSLHKCKKEEGLQCPGKRKFLKL